VEGPESLLRYILFHQKRHPSQLDVPHVAAYLSHLATAGGVSPSTQNQALAALLFLYREVLGRELGHVHGIVRARYKKRLPQVPSHDECLRIIGELNGRYRVVANLLYGTGMRVSECLNLRIKDLDFERMAIAIVNGKGGKDPFTLLPVAIVPGLKTQLAFVRRLFDQDLETEGSRPCQAAQLVEHRQRALFTFSETGATK
jgi:site-specific recombinase XerD